MVIVVLDNQGIQRMHQQEKAKGIVPCNYSRKDMSSVNEKCLAKKLFYECTASAKTAKLKELTYVGSC